MYLGQIADLGPTNQPQTIYSGNISKNIPFGTAVLLSSFRETYTEGLSILHPCIYNQTKIQRDEPAECFQIAPPIHKHTHTHTPAPYIAH